MKRVYWEVRYSKTTDKCFDTLAAARQWIRDWGTLRLPWRIVKVTVEDVPLRRKVKP